MIRLRSVTVLAMVLALGAALVAATDARAAEGSRRGFGRGGRSSLLGLIGREEVQKELKLSEDQTAKVQKVIEKLGAEMRKQFTALREIEDREKQRAKMTELRDQFDRNAREQLGDVLEREQMMRLYQIRMQYRAVVDSLANRFVAGRLKLTDEQKAKLAEITKEMQAKRSELFAAMRDASEEQRAEVFQKFGKIQSDADQKALATLTAEQKGAFEKMKGEKFELPSRRRQ
ncbi:MAG: Spy/CpxP family protein refolding chaperone [Planctomycetota bacterium]